MITFPALFASEVHRCLARRAVRVLVLIALAGIAVMGVVAFVVTDADELAHSSSTSLARLSDLWVDGGDATLAPPLIFLGIGALIGGAVVVGGEWKTGNVTTVATWEVRRGRLLAARLLACGVLAPLIGLALLVVFVGATLPTVFAKGTTAGLDGEWALTLAGGVGRALVIVALAAVFGGVLASLGRSTAGALATVFVYNAVVENIVRARWPERGRWLLGENLATWFTGAQPEHVPFERGPLLAIATLVAYVVVLAVAAVLVFRRRDIAGAA